MIMAVFCLSVLGYRYYGVPGSLDQVHAAAYHAVAARYVYAALPLPVALGCARCRSTRFAHRVTGIPAVPLHTHTLRLRATLRILRFAIYTRVAVLNLGPPESHYACSFAGLPLQVWILLVLLLPDIGSAWVRAGARVTT